MKGKGPNWSVSGPSAGARTGTNETENSGEKVVAAAGRAAGTGGGGTGPASQDAAQSSDAAPIQL